MEKLTAIKDDTIFNIASSCRLSLFGGKGGVGKTTLAACMAAALAKASPQEQIFLLSLDPSHSLSALFKDSLVEPDKGLSGKSASALCTTKRFLDGLPNLNILELNFSGLTEGFQNEYGLSIETLVEQGTLLSDSDVEAFVDVSLPALGELMALMEITELLEANAAVRVIVDSAPTGHTLRLLELPEFLKYLAEVLSLMDKRQQLVASSMIGPGRSMPVSPDEEVLAKMTERAQALKSFLVDGKQCGAIVVSLAERLPLAETEHMLLELKNKGIEVKAILLNKVAPSACSFCRERFLLQQKYLIETAREFSPIPLFISPLSSTEPRSLGDLQTLAMSIRQADAEPAVSLGGLEAEPLTKISMSGQLPDFVAKGLKLLIFAGKGGVGKTSIAAASALVLAEQHPEKRLLVASIDPAHSLGHSFGRKFSTDPTQVGKNLWAAEVDAKTLLAEFKDTYFKEVDDFLVGLLPGASSGSSGISFGRDREITDKLLHLETPDLDEFMVFRWLTQIETNSHFDLILLDPAPAGHLLRFLELPNIAKKWIKAFLSVINKHRAVEKTQETVRELLSLMKAIRSFEAEIRNPQQTALIAVGTPQEVVLVGMLDMLAHLDVYGVRLDSIVINMLRDDQTACAFCHQLHLSQEACIDAVRDQLGQFNLVTVGQANTEIQGEPSLTILGRALYGR